MGAAMFYHVTRSAPEAVAAMLVDKALAAGWRVELRAVAEDRLARFDELLWAREGFLPHGRAGGAHDARMVGIGLDELKTIPTRICVAGGPQKLAAIRGALAGGYATHLVTDLDTAAAAQVAFATAVHETAPQLDFFTAIDELSGKRGVSMMGTKVFDASVLYRYANVDLASLRENLGEDVDAGEIAAAFVEAFILSMPTGAQNSYAARTLPSAVVVVASERPKSLANAFLEPVEEDFIAEATRRLVAGERTLAERVEQPKAVWRISLDGLADAELGEQSTLAELLDGVRAIASEA